MRYFKPTNERRCIDCNTTIKFSIGFTLAKDLLDGSTPREICGRCALKIIGMSEDKLIKWSEDYKGRNKTI